MVEIKKQVSMENAEGSKEQWAAGKCLCPSSAGTQNPAAWVSSAQPSLDLRFYT